MEITESRMMQNVVELIHHMEKTEFVQFYNRIVEGTDYPAIDGNQVWWNETHDIKCIDVSTEEQRYE